MVADLRESSILGDIQNLEDEIAALQVVIDSPYYAARRNIFSQILKRLESDLVHQTMRLKIHRQRVRESGIKY